MSRATPAISCAVLLLLLAAACGHNVPAAAPPNADEPFGRLERSYAVYLMTRFPVVATYLGGSAFDRALAEIDGRLRDASADSLAQEDARLRDFRDRFAALSEQTLSSRRRIDRSVVLAQIDFLVHQHATRRHQERALDTYVDEPFRGVDWQIQGMTPTGATTYGTEAEWRQVIARVRAVPTYLATAETQLAAGVSANNTPDWRVIVQFGLTSSMADAEYFSKTLPGIASAAVAGPHRQALLNDIRAAGQRAAEAYKGLRDFVAVTFFDEPDRTDGSGLKPRFRADRFALGEAEYDWALRNNLRIDKSAAALFAESWPIVEATRNSMISLAREIAARRHWDAPADGAEIVRIVFDKMSEDAPKNDGEMLEWYRRAGVNLVDYARRTGIFEVPADYRLDVTETPPPLRFSIDGAAYYSAPPFKTTGVGRFYVTPTGDDVAQLRELHNRAAIPDLAAHEGFPGHDWHSKVMSRHRDEISPVRWFTPGAVEDSSSMWQDSMATEGWALYSEALLAEPQPGAPDGFYTPEARLYQLRGSLYRELRVRVDTGIHTGRMQFDDAVTLFSEVTDFLPGSCTDAKALRLGAKRASCESARSAVTRYARWPTQAITYRLGKDQIIALRERARAKLGAKFSPQRFHLEFMKQGTIPAGYFGDELLRALEQ
jgi:uncharacterized protein (DUF885 family)